VSYAEGAAPHVDCTLQHVAWGVQQAFVVELQPAVCWQPAW
jgi:hypothetical protein